MCSDFVVWFLKTYQPSHASWQVYESIRRYLRGPYHQARPKQDISLDSIEAMVNPEGMRSKTAPECFSPWLSEDKVFAPTVPLYGYEFNRSAFLGDAEAESTKKKKQLDTIAEERIDLYDASPASQRPPPGV
jgi:hypothetical protein